MKKFVNVLILGVVVIGVLMYKKCGVGKNQGQKVLFVELPCMPETLDPTLSTDGYAAVEMCKVYEGLLEYHYLKRPAELIPNLAESMPDISDDGLTYTFKIKQGVYFQDNKCFEKGKGRELIAQDFVYTFLRFADTKTQSSLYGMIDGHIVGLNEWRDKYKNSDKADYSEIVIGIQAIDKYTLKFTLTKPWPQFLAILTMPMAFAIPREAADYYGKDFGNHPVGTGPFIIENFKPQENKIVAIKNPTYRVKYYPTDASEECKYMLIGSGHRLPFVDKIETYIITEDQPRWLQFKSKKIDIVDLRGMSDLARLVINDEPNEELKKSGILLMKKPYSMTTMFYFNNTVEPFKDNIYLRQAMSMALNRNRYNKLFCDDFYVVAQSFIPPTLAGYDKDFRNVNYVYNIEEAKKLMIKAGYPDGKGLPTITIESTASTRNVQSAEFFKKCMADIGITINISSNSFPELMNKSISGRYQMYAASWVSDYPDAENFLVLFNSGSISHGGYKNPEYSKLFNQANTLHDGPERTKLYEEMNKILANDVPALFLVHPTRMMFYYKWVKNFLYFDPKQYDFAQYLDVDINAKKEGLKK